MNQKKLTISDRIIDEEKSKPMSSYPKTCVTTTTAQLDSNRPKRPIVQDFLLLWLAVDIDQSKEDFQNTLEQLQSVVNEVHIFAQRDEAIDFLIETHDVRAFLLLGDTIGQQIVPLIHDIHQLDGIYIFCGNKSSHEQSAKEWVKVKGIHTEIMSLCKSLQQDVKQCNQDSIPISLLPMSEGSFNTDLDQLEASFMYTQIFKEILLDMEYDGQSVKDFTTYCRNGNYGAPNNIDRIENEYSDKSAIWWYTFPSFIYSMLNAGLRMLEADTIISMGFFIHDLHQQIEQLHHIQVGDYHGKSFIVYRGQGLLKADFETLLQTKGGLISFNNFLSTTEDQDVSLEFAMTALIKTDMVGILFRMSIDPSVSSPPFASIREMSYFKTEKEILFSMHTVFRIGEITKIDSNSSLYQVDLKLTADDDQQLRTLTERIREEITGETGWERLAVLLIKIRHYHKAEELYNLLIDQKSDEIAKALYYTNLGYVKHDQGDYEKAIEYYKKGLEIRQKTLPSNHPNLATSYNNIGAVYHNIKEYSKALSFYEKALEIRQKTLSPNHLELAVSHHNIGAVYDNMKEYSKALLFYEKAFEISQKTLPPNHPDFAKSYNNIGVLYQSMGEYWKALSFHEKALEICQKTLLPNHPELARSYNSIGCVYQNKGEHSKALSFFEKGLEIRQKTLPANHPDLASSYNSIVGVHYHMKEHSKALSCYKKALEIRQKTLPPNHPSLATSHNDIGEVYYHIGEYSEALSFYKKGLEIFEKTLPENHPDLATSYNKIAGVYHHMEEYSIALSFFEKALEIRQKTFPPNHCDLTTSYNNIGAMYHNMREYSKALPFFEKALEIGEKTLPANHPDLDTFYSNIGEMYNNMGEHSKALSFYEKALEIRHKNLPPHDLSLITSYNSIGQVYNNMREYSKALSFYEKALEISQKNLPSNHPVLATFYNEIGELYRKTGEYLEALLVHQKALEIRQTTLPPNHPDLAPSYNSIGLVYKSMGEYSKALSFYQRALNILQSSLPPNHPSTKTVQENIELLKQNL